MHLLVISRKLLIFIQGIIARKLDHSAILEVFVWKPSFKANSVRSDSGWSFFGHSRCSKSYQTTHHYRPYHFFLIRMDVDNISRCLSAALPRS